MNTRVNERGNTVSFEHVGSVGRYVFDFQHCNPSDGWKQYDTTQDAAYFGVWYHMEKREIVTYAEGDLSRVVCPTAESFKAEIKHMNAFYGFPPPAMVSFDDKGNRTEHYDRGARPFGDVVPRPSPKFYIQRKGQGYRETVDEFDTRGEARAMLAEYRMSDPSAEYYISTRPCANWKG